MVKTVLNITLVTNISCGRVFNETKYMMKIARKLEAIWKKVLNSEPLYDEKYLRPK